MVRSFLFVFVLALGVVLSLGAARFAFAQEDPVVLFEAAREHHKAWRLDEAKEAYLQAVPLFEASDAKSHLAETHNFLGDIAVLHNYFNEAESHHREALALYEGLDDKGGIAASYNKIGTVVSGLSALETIGYESANLDESQDLYQQALDLYDALGDQKGMAETYNLLGTLEVNSGSVKDAEKLFRRAREISESLDYKRELADSYAGLALIAVGGTVFEEADEDELEEAESFIDKALELYEENGDEDRLVAAYFFLGGVEVIRSDWIKAGKFFKKSVKLSDKLDNKMLSAIGYFGLAGVAGYRGDYSRTCRELRRSESLFEESLARMELSQAIEDEILSGVRGFKDELQC